jgi:hypothetical protein
LNRFSEDTGYKPSTLAKYLHGNSYAEVEDFCLGVLRQHILAMGNKSLKSIFRSRIKQLRDRFSV